MSLPLRKRLAIDVATISNTNRVSNVRLKHSSSQWLERQRKDLYAKMSRYDDYRARSAFKLIQIDDKYQILKPGSIVIEAGAAPGSWTQVICRRMRLSSENNKLTNPEAGLCIAVDISAIEPVDGAICIGNADFTSPFTQGKILTWLDGRRADCVLSDMAPKATGLKQFNHTLIVNLVKGLIPFSVEVLRPGGDLLFKLWDGEETQEIVGRMRILFDTVLRVKPQASRGDSSEVYILCRGRKKDEGRKTQDLIMK